jgi:tRNA G37 N-methylase TrmD
MKNHSATYIARKARKQTFKQNNGNSKVHVDDIKSWKDDHDHENIRRQRQDLFDGWEQETKQTISKTPHKGSRPAT